MPRNAFPGPGVDNLDARVSRFFTLHEESACSSLPRPSTLPTTRTFFCEYERSAWNAALAKTTTSGSRTPGYSPACEMHYADERLHHSSTLCLICGSVRLASYEFDSLWGTQTEFMAKFIFGARNRERRPGTAVKSAVLCRFRNVNEGLL